MAILSGLAPFHDGQIGEVRAMVSALFVGFPSSRADQQSAEATIKLYSSALIGVPLWAVAKACRDVIEGRREDKADHNFAPSSAVLRRMAETKVAALEMERADIDKVLAAQVYREISQAERERLHKAMVALAKECSLLGDRKSEPSFIDRCIDAGIPDPRPLPALSTHVRQKLGLYIRPQDTIDRPSCGDF